MLSNISNVTLREQCHLEAEAGLHLYKCIDIGRNIDHPELIFKYIKHMGHAV